MSNVVSGTFYDDRTSAAVIAVLERARASRIRVRLHYGDTETGQDWMDTYGVAGRISRSMGPIRVPILLDNERSGGGPQLLDHAIVRIRYSDRKAGGDLYRHPLYHLDESAIESWPDRDAVLRREFR
jgi:hypothetical protein